MHHCSFYQIPKMLAAPTTVPCLQCRLCTSRGEVNDVHPTSITQFQNLLCNTNKTLSQMIYLKDIMANHALTLLLSETLPLCRNLVHNSILAGGLLVGCSDQVLLL
jgi:hypothetical protein